MLFEYGSNANWRINVTEGALKQIGQGPMPIPFNVVKNKYNPTY
jgi:hypothetical protein